MYQWRIHSFLRPSGKVGAVLGDDLHFRWSTRGGPRAVQQGRAEDDTGREGRGGAVQGSGGAATSGAAAVQFWAQEVLGAARVAWGFFEVNLVGLGRGQPAHLAQILNW
jgi:hypothetical protein